MTGPQIYCSFGRNFLLAGKDKLAKDALRVSTNNSNTFTLIFIPTISYTFTPASTSALALSKTIYTGVNL